MRTIPVRNKYIEKQKSVRNKYIEKQKSFDLLKPDVFVDESSMYRIRLSL